MEAVHLPGGRESGTTQSEFTSMQEFLSLRLVLQREIIRVQLKHACEIFCECWRASKGLLRLPGGLNGHVVHISVVLKTNCVLAL